MLLSLYVARNPTFESVISLFILTLSSYWFLHYRSLHFSLLATTAMSATRCQMCSSFPFSSFLEVVPGSCTFLQRWIRRQLAKQYLFSVSFSCDRYIWPLRFLPAASWLLCARPQTQNATFGVVLCQGSRKESVKRKECAITKVFIWKGKERYLVLCWQCLWQEANEVTGFSISVSSQSLLKMAIFWIYVHYNHFKDWKRRWYLVWRTDSPTAGSSIVSKCCPERNIISCCNLPPLLAE